LVGTVTPNVILDELDARRHSVGSANCRHPHFGQRALDSAAALQYHIWCVSRSSRTICCSLLSSIRPSAFAELVAKEIPSPYRGTEFKLHYYELHTIVRSRRTIPSRVIQLDRLLRRYGPETDNLRVLLRRYAATRSQDLFPQGSAKPVLQNSKTITLFEEREDRLAAMEGHSAQRWLMPQAKTLEREVMGERPGGCTCCFIRGRISPLH
jgi:hypothetical protein